MKQLIVLTTVVVVSLLAVAAKAEEKQATLESLTKDLANSEAQIRSQACYSLGKMGAKARPAALKIGNILMMDESPSVRQIAAQALGEIAIHTRQTPREDDAILVDMLAKAMRDSNADVRLMAAQAIGNFMRQADSKTLSIAVVATSDGDKRVRKAAVRSLGMIGRGRGPESKKAVPYLTKALSDSDPEISRLATYVLSFFGETSLPALPKLIETLRNGPPQAQKEAARTLGGQGAFAISAVPLLLEKVKQEHHWELRVSASKALVRINPTQLETVAEILIESSRSIDSGTRFFALEALLEVDKERAYIIPTLERMQNDKIVEIQLLAKEAIEDVKEQLAAKERQQARKANVKNESKDTKITFKDATQEDADAALTMLRTFINHWQNKDYKKAEALVDERLRFAWRKQMERRLMHLQSIDDIRVIKHKDILRARAHISIAPKGGLGLDLIFRDGKWWMTGS